MQSVQSLTSVFVWSANQAVVGLVARGVHLYGVRRLTHALGVNPLLAGAFTLEHQTLGGRVIR